VAPICCEDVAGLVQIERIWPGHEQGRRRQNEHRSRINHLRLLRVARSTLVGTRASEAFEGDGQDLFRHACAFGLKGIISKRRTSPFRLDRCDDLMAFLHGGASEG